MALAPLSASFQSLPPLPTIKLGPSAADSRVGGLVQALGPCGSLQWPVLWGWESLLLLPQPHPPRYFQWEVWGFISLSWNPWLLGLSHSPVIPPSLSACKCGTACSTSRFAHSSPPATTLLRVVSTQLPISAPPTGLDECFFFIYLVVRLPYSLIFVSSGCFSFLNLLLSFFWLCEEAECIYHASILARSRYFRILTLILGFIYHKYSIAIFHICLHIYHY